MHFILILTGCFWFSTIAIARVVDGEKSAVPQVVKMQMAGGGLCSGTGVGDAVITAAHCLEGGNSATATATIDGKEVTQTLTCEAHPEFAVPFPAKKAGEEITAEKGGGAAVSDKKGMSRIDALESRLQSACRQYVSEDAKPKGSDTLKKALHKSILKLAAQIEKETYDALPPATHSTDYTKDVAVCWADTVESKLTMKPACIEPPPEAGSEEAKSIHHVGYGYTGKGDRMVDSGVQRKGEAATFAIGDDGVLISSTDRSLKTAGILPGDSGGFMGDLSGERPVLYGVHSRTTALQRAFDIPACKAILVLRDAGSSLSTNVTSPENLKFIRSVAKKNGLKICVRTEERAQLAHNRKVGKSKPREPSAELELEEHIY